MIRCIIIEDEPIARDVLKTYVQDTPSIVLVDEFENAVDGLAFLQKESIDLIFLDINMPKLSGISFLKSLDDPPKVIITTAYSEYALEGYELDVVDYLLKPFSFERFLKAVNKVALKKSETKEESITVKADGKLFRISLSEILCAEALGDYVTLYTESQKLTFNSTLTSFIEELNSENFIRIHRSYAVSLSKINYVEGNIISIKEHEIPVGKSYREEFRKRFEK
ncbi:MAG: LytTR family DNA-binding domain-containing protein [Balneola sp.]